MSFVYNVEPYTLFDLKLLPHLPFPLCPLATELQVKKHRLRGHTLFTAEKQFTILELISDVAVFLTDYQQATKQSSTPHPPTPPDPDPTVSLGENLLRSDKRD